jgi:hypothetical protein
MIQQLENKVTTVVEQVTTLKWLLSLTAAALVFLVFRGR